MRDKTLFLVEKVCVCVLSVETFYSFSLLLLSAIVHLHTLSLIIVRCVCVCVRTLAAVVCECFLLIVHTHTKNAAHSMTLGSHSIAARLVDKWRSLKVARRIVSVVRSIVRSSTQVRDVFANVDFGSASTAHSKQQQQSSSNGRKPQQQLEFRKKSDCFCAANCAHCVKCSPKVQLGRQLCLN